MRTLHPIRRADCAPQPSRNGRGGTRGLLAWPRREGGRVCRPPLEHE